MCCSKHLKRIAELETQLGDARALQHVIDRSTAVIELSPDGTILGANGNFCTTVGYSASELAGAHHRQLCDEAFAGSREYAEVWNRLRAGELFRGTRSSHRHKNGTAICLEATYNPILEAGGKVAKVVKFAADVTRQVSRGNPDARNGRGHRALDGRH